MKVGCQRCKEWREEPRRKVSRAAFTNWRFKSLVPLTLLRNRWEASALMSALQEGEVPRTFLFRTPVVHLFLTFSFSFRRSPVVYWTRKKKKKPGPVVKKKKPTSFFRFCHNCWEDFYLSLSRGQLIAGFFSFLKFSYCMTIVRDVFHTFQL